jgi:hypothetical protein
LQYEGTPAASATDAVSGTAANKKDDDEGSYVDPGRGLTIWEEEEAMDLGSRLEEEEELLLCLGWSRTRKQDCRYSMHPSILSTLFVKSLYTRYTAENTHEASYAALDSGPMERECLLPGAKADFRCTLQITSLFGYNVTCAHHYSCFPIIYSFYHVTIFMLCIFGSMVIRTTCTHTNLIRFVSAPCALHFCSKSLIRYICFRSLSAPL